MTWIPKISTPLADIINIGDDLSVHGEVSVINDCNISGNLTVDQDVTLGSGLSSEITFQAGVIKGLSSFMFSASSPTVDFNFNDTLFIDTSAKRVGIGISTPSTDLHVVGDTIVRGNLDAGGGALYVDSINNRVGIGTTSPNFALHVVGNLLKVGSATYPNTLFANTVINRVGINTSLPSAKLHIFESTVSNKKIDSETSVVLEKSGHSAFQIVSQHGAGCSVVLFTGAPTTATSNRHWSIFGNWTGVGASFQNNLAFGYYDGTNTAPFSQTAANTLGYLDHNANVDNIDFTGQHRCEPAIENLNYYSDKVGLIVVSDGTYSLTLDPNDSNDTISINEAIPKVKLSNKRNDKTVFGVISDSEDIENSRHYSSGRFISVFEKRENDHRLIINSLGEGGIWICSINGNLENGDYITTCEIPGFGMKQDREDLMNYTVAKITCDCDFNLSSSVYKCEEFQFSGSTYRKAFVGCTYHCG